MRKAICVLLTSGAMALSGASFAAQHEGKKEEANVAFPMEMYACSYNEGMGPADVDAASKVWNAWADSQGIKDYSAWTLVPYYHSDEQEFDILWFGSAANAATLGRVQDTWLATGSESMKEWARVVTCGTHAAYSVLTMKQPPKRELTTGKLIVTFSDCKTADGVNFDQLYEPLIEWGKYRAEKGSKGGYWVFFPAYGGGKEDFAFKWATAYESLADMGADWDEFNEGGWAKVNELLQGKLQCDSSRTYLATSRRQAATND